MASRCSYIFQHNKQNQRRDNIAVPTVADPGFPVGGRAPVRGAVDPQLEHFSVKIYAKMKELGPIRGGVRRARPPPDPPMTNIRLV